MDSLQKIWLEFKADFQTTEDLAVVPYLVIGGLLAIYIRFLYERFNSGVSDPDPITRVFPLLILVTTAVIAVVKSSLALSLGLVGALSIVRFRAAIKDPEELVYLFFCIAVGLCLGAREPLLAFALVFLASVFVAGLHLTGKGRRQSVLLTVSGAVDPHFVDPEEGLLAAISAAVPKFTVQRYDLEDGHGQIRVLLGTLKTADVLALVAKLRSRFPDCHFSYVNVETTL